MKREKVYNFLHKQIRNVVPTKNLQRFLIESMRSRLFPELLDDVRVATHQALAEGCCKKLTLRPAGKTPPAKLFSITGVVPEDLCMPEMETPELNDYVLDDGYCFRHFALDKQRRFISDATLSGLFSRDLYRNNKNIRALPCKRIEAEAIALNTGHTDNYYHWMFDLVGRMLLMPDWEDKILVSDTRFSFQRDTFKVLGIPPERIIPLTDYGLYQFPKLHVISAPFTVSKDSYIAVASLADRLGADAGVGAWPRRIYISRGDVAKRRGIENESELLPIFEAFGFTRVLFTGMPLEKQIRHMAAAECVVFPHGAAGTNLVFCRPDMRFLELVSPKLFDPGYVRISKTLGFTHHILLGETTPEKSIQDPFRIDPDQLRQALEALTGGNNHQ